MVATLLLVAIPGVVALDYGGALPWTIWILSAMAMLLVVMVAFGDSQTSSSWGALLDELHLASTDTDPSSRPSDQPRLVPHTNPRFASSFLEWGARWTPLLLVLCFAFVAMLQTMPWGAAFVSWLSPASAKAYQGWAPTATGTAALEQFSVSVSPWLTTNFTARAIILAAFAYAAGCLMRHRHFVLAMLIGLAGMALIHAAVGHYQQAVSPHVNLFGSRRVGQPFGTFVNRSHAGALLNIGLACAIGLISVRLHGHRDYPSRRQHGLHGSFQRLLIDRAQTLLFDKPSLFLSLGIVFIVSAILACGSRGALLGMLAGTLACAACTVSTQRMPLFLLTAAFVAFIALMTMGKTGIEASSLERFLESSPSMTQNNARLQHWPDGLRAARASLPMGGGLGAYRYVHLPYQQTSGPNWFQNADNQWVEWLAEGGLPITGALLCTLATTLVLLRRLLSASDPVNRGLAVAGVFAVAAIGVSQTFDFALTVSSVAIAATLLAAAIHVRATEHAPRALTRSSTFHWVGPIFLVVLVAWAQKQIHGEASATAILNRSKAQLADAGLDYADLLTQEQTLARAIEEVPDCDSLLNQQCIVQQRLYRIERIGRLLSQQRISLEKAAQTTKLSQIHANKEQLGDPPLHEDARLQRITELSRHELELCPLSETARWNLALLDFSAGYRTRAPSLLRQLSILRCRNGDALTQVATLASQMEQPQLAAQAWRQLLSIDERRLPEVIEQLTASGTIQLHQVLPIEGPPTDTERPKTRELLLRAAEYQLQLPPQQRDPIVLGWAMDLLRIPISAAERDLKVRLNLEGTASPPGM